MAKKKIIRIKRKCNVGEENTNGYKYDRESYNSALEKFQEAIEYGIDAELFFGTSGSRYSRYLKESGMIWINKPNCCGKIVKVANTYIELELSSTKIESLFDIYMGVGLIPKAYMRYLCKKGLFNDGKVEVDKIITFDIIFPSRGFKYKCETMEQVNMDIYDVLNSERVAVKEWDELRKKKNYEQL